MRVCPEKPGAPEFLETFRIVSRESPLGFPEASVVLLSVMVTMAMMGNEAYGSLNGSPVCHLADGGGLLSLFVFLSPLTVASARALLRRI